MTKVQQNLLNSALRTGHTKTACLIALCASIERANCVYLPNAYAEVKHAVTPAQWAGYLSALAKEGSYAPADNEHAGYFGYVLSGSAI